MPRTVALALNLFKVRIGVVIALTAVAGMALQPGGPLAWWRAVALALAVLVSSAAAGAFNQYYEADLDRTMRRTRSRPFATGTYTPDGRWLALIVAMIGAGVALAWLATNALAALFTFLGAFFYAVVYTVWLKRRSWMNIVIGGLAGSFAVLAGAAAIAPSLSPEALLLALVLFLWTPPHFWSLAIAYRDDYAQAGVPMLPVVKGDRAAARAVLAHTVALVAASLAPAWFSAGPIYLAGAVLGGAVFLVYAVGLAREPGRASAMRCFHASLLQLSLLLVAILLDGAWHP